MKCDIHHVDCYWGELQETNCDEASGRSFFAWICPECCKEDLIEKESVYRNAEERTKIINETSQLILTDANL